MRIWSNLGPIGQLGPKLERDAWWMATAVGLAAYVVLQALTLAASVLVFLGRAANRCLVGPECDLVAGWPDGFVGLACLVGATLSIGILAVLWRLGKALWRRDFWVAWALRAIGWGTFLVGLVAVLGWGLPWLIVGASLLLTSRRMRTGSDWPGMAGMGGAPGAAPGNPPRDGGPVHQIHIDDEPVDRDRVVDVQFEDK